MANPSYRSYNSDLHNLPCGPCTVIVLNPRYKSQIIACHENITETDAAELVAVYRALGYADRFISFLRQEAAA